MTSQFASFSPYTPPPDDPEYNSTTGSSSSHRAWFPNYQSQAGETSYQSGGIPTFNNSVTGGETMQDNEVQNQWETRLGLRVDLWAAFAYLLGPISALIVLVLETQNDFVRFHGYQSALMTGPLLVTRLLLSLLRFPQWLRTIFTVLIWSCQLYMVVRTYIDASNGLMRLELPFIGVLASQWVVEE
ncbi:hypothetical protein K435DRAFT_961654 [Dendrothele bispora CBS 962.96]|uniref:Uncharacterized protein n=1 Tax=Dendrothele bispora (strain CBS 962.96) TaxID=1314807 RepID=A0A4V4HI22_DENBC|nr:hypothetical protein K435DRAFT_961654 [Dendrothele bispora CBS 962.96]